LFSRGIGDKNAAQAYQSRARSLIGTNTDAGAVPRTAPAILDLSPVQDD